MGQMLDVVRDYCEHNEFTYRAVKTRWPDLHVLSLGFPWKTAPYDCFLEAHEDSDMFLVYSYIPETVPEAKRTQVALYLTRANHGLKSGCFELDLGDGRVRFRNGLNVENDRLTTTL